MRVFRNRLLASVLGAGVSLLLAASQAGAQPPSSDSRVNVVINGTTLNGSPATVVARVPILAAGNTGFHQLGIGFDRFSHRA